ncbi:MAG: multidrug effflux MFS transporter, partial [Boseongicola sp. SB0673_bin_14]|nr:multidrug effflux MFS transporter [Boseongicola sp. SB0673_bin_14]
MRHAADVRFPDRTTPPHILTLVLMSGLSALSMSIILPSMPQMTRDLGTRYEVI